MVKRIHLSDENNSLYEGRSMKNTVEIRWHGRGGQGAKTAALLLADVAFKTGCCVQGFPEYGPERMGAPITAFNRISEDKIRVHSNIYDPDYVVVVDETLLHCVDVTNGLKREGAVIVNTANTSRYGHILPAADDGSVRALGHAITNQRPANSQAEWKTLMPDTSAHHNLHSQQSMS